MAVLLGASVFPVSVEAGDAFFKVGMVFHPDIGGVGDRWFLSVGSDWGVHPAAFVGVEFQGAYHSQSAAGVLSVSSVPANVFANAKWKHESDGVRPYAGAGLGLVSALVKTEILGVSDYSYERDAGFQLMGGVEINRRFVVELLGQRVLADGGEFAWSVLGGVTW
jgi:opacity protein-like surface antigen